MMEETMLWLALALAWGNVLFLTRENRVLKERLFRSEVANSDFELWKAMHK